MEVTVEKLFEHIGRLYIQAQVLEAEVNTFRQETMAMKAAPPPEIKEP